MLSTITVSASALVLASFLQLCPAPPVVIAAGITASGAIIGGAISTAGKVKRQELPPGVPQEEYDRCFDELKTANVVVSGPVGNNGIQADGVPPTCMNLATVLVGDPVDGPYPTVLGSSSLLYDNLTPEQFDNLREILGK